MMVAGRHGLFIAQLLTIVLLLLLAQLDVQAQPILISLLVLLLGLWLVGSVMAPFSLLLSALVLAGTTSTLSLLHVNGVPFSMNGILVAALGMVSALAVAIHYRQQFATPHQIRRWLLDAAPFLFFLVWALLRTPATPSLKNAVSDIMIWASVACVYTLARAFWIAHPQRIKEGENAFIYVALLPLAAIVLDALLGNVYINYTSSELSLGIHTTGGARSTPPFLVLVMVPILVRLRTVPTDTARVHWLLVGLVAVMSAWVYFSLARITLLGMVGIVLPLALLRPRTLRKAALAVAVGTVICVGVVLSPLYPRPTFVDLNSVVTFDAGDDTGPTRARVNDDTLRTLSFGRTGAWEYLVDLVLYNKPVIGFGTGASHVHVKAANPVFDHPHNDYLRIFFDMGAVGLLIFVLSWGWKLLQLWRNWVHVDLVAPVAYRNLIAAIAAAYILVAFLTDNFLVYFFMMGPLAILLALADAETFQAAMGLENTQPAMALAGAQDRGPKEFARSGSR